MRINSEAWLKNFATLKAEDMAQTLCEDRSCADIVRECRVCHRKFPHPAPSTGGTWTCSDACRMAEPATQPREGVDE
jgi:hypothetical protein